MVLFQLVLAVAVALSGGVSSRSYAAPESRAAAAGIIEHSDERSDEFGYSFRFVSSDDITRQEETSDDGAVTGFYSYISPEGIPVRVTYVADELGFRAQSDALPTPVPTEYPTPAVPVTETGSEARAQVPPVLYQRVLVGYRRNYQ